MSARWTTDEHERLAERAAWAVTALLEAGDTDGATVISLQYHPAAMERGLSLVIAVLLRDLRHHSEDRGCRCGSLEWVREHALNPPGNGPEKGPE